MKKQRIIIALGGNAIHNKGEKGTFEEQFSNIKKTMEYIAGVLVNGKYEVVITHGNGPQVGNLMTYTGMPIHLCGAMSQSEIGYLIQQSLGNILEKSGINKKIATIVTQIVVDKNSPGFKNPTKPVGNFYTEKEAEKINKETGFIFKEDCGRGWRRVVPSPEPYKIIEIESIKNILDSGAIVICGGGGGIPVIEGKCGLMGIDAVIDKDKTAALLGNNLDADMLIILTTVPKVYLNYQKSNQIPLDILNHNLAKQYLKEGHFAEGSMKPKIEAALSFIGKNKNRKVVITNAGTFKDALSLKNGTLVVY